ncbi:hypothetical protein MMC28_011614, partial [Mycoblastus sanguinarius]|nr:hypothetical protein [Mycoblastus sanguinarius]
ASDLQVITDLAYELCTSVGGIAMNSTLPSMTSPTPAVFTGGAACMDRDLVGGLIVGLVAMFEWLVM